MSGLFLVAMQNAIFKSIDNKTQYLPEKNFQCVSIYTVFLNSVMYSLKLSSLFKNEKTVQTTLKNCVKQVYSMTQHGLSLKDS